MSELLDLRLLRLIPLAALLFSARAFAQFEVAPDHFDSKPKNQAPAPKSTKSKTGAALPAKATAITKTTPATQTASIPGKRSAGGRTSPAARQSQSQGSAHVDRAAAELQEKPRGRD